MRIFCKIAQLDALDEGPTAAMIANQLRLARPTLSRFIYGFVNAGWMIEAVSKKDRRQRVLMMTEDGWNVLDHMVALFP